MLNVTQRFFEKYNKIPTKSVLELSLEKDNSISDDEYSNGMEFIQTLTNTGEDFSWLVDQSEIFCKERSLFNALQQSLKIKENSEKPIEERDKKIKDVGVLPEILSEALSVCFDKSVGHDYLEDYEDRYSVYHDKNTKIRFDIEILNRITKGGIESKTLNLLQAGVNTGKSMGLCHLAASYLNAGHNVLYISMEMGEIQGVAKRIDANLLDTTLDNLDELDETTYINRVKRIKDKITGKLVIKQYPTGSAHVGHFKALLNELQQKKDFKPNIVIIDYLGICASARINGYSENSYHMVKTIAEELRGMAIEYDVAIWSAAQTTRGAWGQGDMDMADIAESAGLAATADFILGIIETEETIASGQQMFKQLKSRYGNKDINNKFMIGVDKGRQKWYETDDFSATHTTEAEEKKADVASHTKTHTQVDDASQWNF